jgi:hypothetical protein
MSQRRPDHPRIALSLALAACQLGEAPKPRPRPPPQARRPRARPRPAFAHVENFDKAWPRPRPKAGWCWSMPWGPWLPHLPVDAELVLNDAVAAAVGRARRDGRALIPTSPEKRTPGLPQKSRSTSGHLLRHPTRPEAKPRPVARLGVVGTSPRLRPGRPGPASRDGSADPDSPVLLCDRVEGEAASGGDTPRPLKNARRAIR